MKKFRSDIGRPTAKAELAQKEEIRKNGISASPGIVIGTAFLMDSDILLVPDIRVRSSDVKGEIEKFERALEDTKKELSEIKASLTHRMGEDHAKIFDAHLLILDDVMVTEDTVSVIQKEKLSAASAFQKVLSQVMASFSEVQDEYLKDRSSDIMDVKKRVLRKLLGKERKGFDKPTEPSIIISHDLAPGDTAQLDRELTLAYATDLGGRTSHTAILARSQGVPAVVGLENLFPLVGNGDTIIVDGNCGTVVVNPTAETLDSYKKEIERFKKLEEQLLTLTGYPAITLDERRIHLVANIDLPEEVDSVLEYGAEGIGLFRTEYFFIAQEDLPTEEEQYEIYKYVVKKMKDNPVVIRTLDIGGDKIVRYLHSSAELNPFMGWRGIRFCLTRKDIFKTQLRAIYRASAHGNVKIMFPMISQVEEVIKAKEICEEVQDELRRGRFHFDENVEIGIMVETPSAVALADTLAKEVSYFSVGTNDLIQYTLAVDRGNTKISHLYQNLHPSIIRFLRMTVEAAHKRGVSVGLCGEMCGDPFSVPILIGLGFDELSCSPNMIPEVKKIIRSVTYDECKSLVKRVYRYRTVRGIEDSAQDFLKTRIPDLPIFQE
ncbi:MAG: phosphoenolpyruvate--protein phosphotransferase [Candidatus Latescibacteria bacterium]|nr:phosphoenolpyruvate--protein phosphotransferase [Candidatus Latescibacterota bacterium]NIM22099.1 phosphoenolpyruvate--protein phosphotransferase [Candidatus Latescibacterota bacterium]NIM66118.1 phosphoenolpyruvate--protein phosphotransferase [Candidatus Latescibacterota bacterium]NIO02526.1 phosphoenolpyruvate--protein phosphotransferase [Candidatus Latescibacterota bacterium]NIO29437.1 phosphoenolpyruvate--protein phosphotransferase [Candidatus Latescibacterota bacterium]